eukprot:c1390_g1_i1 orf=519-1619(+)
MFKIPAESIEKMYRWGHSTCVLPYSNSNCSSIVLIFGGYGGSARHSRQNDLLLFDCKTSSLLTLNTKNSPAPRVGHTASIVGMKMVVIGGRQDPSKVLDDVCILDLKKMSWTFPKVTGEKFVPRHRHAAVAVGKKVYVFGGLNNMNVLGDLLLLDTDIMQWRHVHCSGAIPCPRFSHSLTSIHQKIYLCGGFDGKILFGEILALDLENSFWTALETTGEGPTAKFSHSVTSLKMFLLVFGGCPVTKHINELFVLDVVSLRWRRVPVALQSAFLLVRHTASLVGNQMLIVGGGVSCYAFGRSFSPPFMVDLDLLLSEEPSRCQSIAGQLSHGLGIIEDTTGDYICALKLAKAYAKKAKDTLKRLNWL